MKAVAEKLYTEFLSASFSSLFWFYGRQLLCVVSRIVILTLHHVGFLNLTKMWAYSSDPVRLALVLCSSRVVLGLTDDRCVRSFRCDNVLDCGEEFSAVGWIKSWLVLPLINIFFMSVLKKDWRLSGSAAITTRLHSITPTVSSTLSITAALRDANLPPAWVKPQWATFSFPEVLRACSSSGGLSGFIHQAPAAGIAAPVTCDRGPRWGNGQRQNTHRLGPQTHRSSSAASRTGRASGISLRMSFFGGRRTARISISLLLHGSVMWDGQAVRLDGSWWWSQRERAVICMQSVFMCDFWEKAEMFHLIWAVGRFCSLHKAAAGSVHVCVSVFTVCSCDLHTETQQEASLLHSLPQRSGTVSVSVSAGDWL